MCKKSNKSINALKRLAILPQGYRLDIVKTYIKSTFIYCDIVYHFCGKMLADKIEKLQERSLRYAYHDYTSSYETLLTQSQLRSLLTDRVITILKEAHKTYNDSNPTPTRHLFNKRIPIQYETRQTVNFTLPPYKTITYGKRSIRFLGSRLWNLIDPEIRLMSINSFTDYLKHDFTITNNTIISHNLTLF